MENLSTKKSSKFEASQWFDSILSQPSLPQPIQSNSNLLKSRWFRLIVTIYIGFSFLFATLHVSSWMFTSSTSSINQSWKYERTYDSDEAYSLISNMSDGLKMSKLFSKGHYDSLKYIQPFWKKASEHPETDEVTLIATTTPSTWKDLVQLAKSWNGPISTTLHVSTKEKEIIKLNIEKEYKLNPELYKNIDIHLVETKDGIEKSASILIPLNVERNLARIYSRTDYVTDIPLDALIATPLHNTLAQHKKKYTALLSKGDILVIPTFEYNRDILLPQTKKELVGLVENEKVFGLYDANYGLNKGPTNFDQWKQANDVYPIQGYTMDYEPITIQSKTIQPWCSERFVDKKSACLLSSYLAGNNFYVLPNDFIIQKPNNQKTAISDLDRVIEKRLYAKFYWEQCVYHGRQLDALGQWTTTQSEHIRQQCSRVIQNWGRGLIGKPE